MGGRGKKKTTWYHYTISVDFALIFHNKEDLFSDTSLSVNSLTTCELVSHFQ